MSEQLDEKCPRCEKGNLVFPSDLGFYDDGMIEICDNENHDGAPCEYWQFSAVWLFVGGFIRHLRKEILGENRHE